MNAEEKLKSVANRVEETLDHMEKCPLMYGDNAETREVLSASSHHLMRAVQRWEALTAD